MMVLMMSGRIKVYVDEELKNSPNIISFPHPLLNHQAGVFIFE